MNASPRPVAEVAPPHAPRSPRIREGANEQRIWKRKCSIVGRREGKVREIPDTIAIVPGGTAAAWSLRSSGYYSQTSAASGDPRKAYVTIAGNDGVQISL